MNGKSEQILEEEREEIIRYGMKRGKVIIVSTLITILIGYFLGIPRQSIVRAEWCKALCQQLCGSIRSDRQIIVIDDHR